MIAESQRELSVYYTSNVGKEMNLYADNYY